VIKLWSYSDKTGKILIRSSRGNIYIFILYHHERMTHGTKSTTCLLPRDIQKKKYQCVWTSNLIANFVHAQHSRFNFPLSEWNQLLNYSFVRISPIMVRTWIHLWKPWLQEIPTGTTKNKRSCLHTSKARASFYLHGCIGWYIRPSPEQYCCYKVYFTDTMVEFDVLNVNFFQKKRVSLLP